MSEESSVPSPPQHADPPERRPRRWRTRLRRVLPWAAGAYLLTAFAATHVPLAPASTGVPHLDKAVHAAIFAGLALLVAAWRVTRFDPPRRAAVVAFVLCLIYGAADELTQTFTANRQADPLDFAADAVGAALGLAAFFPLIRWWRRHA